MGLRVRTGFVGVFWLTIMAFLLTTAALGQTARQTASDELARAESARDRAEELTSHPDYSLVLDRRVALAGKLDSGKRYLKYATDAFGRASSDRNYADAGTLAAKAVEQFDDFASAVRAEMDAIEKERNPPPPPPPPTPEPAPEAEPEDQAADGSSSGDATSGEQAPADEEAPAVESSPPPPPPPPPPPRTRRPPKPLRDAAEAFLAGDYQRTVDILVTKSYGQKTKAQAHMLLLRAAARYQLFLLDGEKEYSLRSEAIEDILACRVADPDLEPAPEVFSPRFRDFFAGTR